MGDIESRLRKAAKQRRDTIRHNGISQPFFASAPMLEEEAADEIADLKAQLATTKTELYGRFENLNEQDAEIDRLKAQLAERDELLAKSRLLIENCQNECDWNITQSGYIAIVEHLKLMDAVDPIEIQD